MTVAVLSLDEMSPSAALQRLCFISSQVSEFHSWENITAGWTAGLKNMYMHMFIIQIDSLKGYSGVSLIHVLTHRYTE